MQMTRVLRRVGVFAKQLFDHRKIAGEDQADGHATGDQVDV
jgi:hypothetical protein